MPPKQFKAAHSHTHPIYTESYDSEIPTSEPASNPNIELCFCVEEEREAPVDLIIDLAAEAWGLVKSVAVEVWVVSSELQAGESDGLGQQKYWNFGDALVDSDKYMMVEHLHY